MCRGERRYHTRRVKSRRLYLLDCEMGVYGRRRLWEKPWRALTNLGKYRMSSCPREWRKVMMIRPARAKSKMMLRKGEFEGAFPDYRKPHIYYW